MTQHTPTPPTLLHRQPPPARVVVRVLLEDLTAELDDAGVFSGLPLDDAELLVAALSYSVCLRDDPARALRARAEAVRAGRWSYQDRAGFARALDNAADLIARVA